MTINHFFVRYTLLELAGLTTLVLLALVRARLDHAFWRNALVFRLADGALLLMILGLFFSMGTFHIETLLSGAATLPRARLWLVAGGGLLAAWVKLALPPFAGWARDARQSPSASLVAVGSGLPLLGAYLLYRLVPLWAALGLELLLMALGLALLAFAVLVHGRSLSERGLLAVDALAVGLAVTPLMPAYLVLFVPLRVALLWYRPAEAELPETASAAVLLRTTLSGAARTMAFVETGLLNRFSRRLTTGTRRVSEGLQALHRGNLGQNMMWICAGLGLLLVMALMLLPIG